MKGKVEESMGLDKCNIVSYIYIWTYNHKVLCVMCIKCDLDFIR